MSRLLDPERLQKEIDAQKRRAEALALLNRNGAEQHYKAGEVRKARDEKEVDNTLEVVTMRRAQQTFREHVTKERLLRQQNSLREGLEQKQSRAARPTQDADDAEAPLPEGWREVKDAKTGATYYWNKSSSTTSWARPVASAKAVSSETKAHDESKHSTASAEVSGREAEAEVEAKGPADARERSAPLPPGWTEVKDPGTGALYYWNKTKGETTWDRPQAEAGAVPEDGETKSEVDANASLPEGWKAVTHAATGQRYYIHEATGKRSFSPPGSEATQPSVDQQEQHQSRRRGHDPSMHARRDARGSASPYSGRGGAEASRGKSRKRGRSSRDEIDPLDPTGKAGGKWSDGLVQVGERMADSTASGPLWQQRPYPAPGKILRERATTEAETAGPRRKE